MLGTLGAILGALGGVLGASWEHFLGIFELFRTYFMPWKASSKRFVEIMKSHQKPWKNTGFPMIFTNRNGFGAPFLGYFGSVLEAFWSLEVILEAI